jgi:hypothetical protein
MTCVELERSLAEVEDGSKTEQQDHLKNCPKCTALVAELLALACAAGDLRAADEPSPRVWNSIEIALRQEGLIRPQRPRLSVLPSFGSQWGWARWLVPAAAVLLITLGIYVRQRSQTQPVARVDATPVVADEASVAGLNDADLFAEIAQQTPDLQAQYTDNLRRVNEYIHDAKTTVDENPSDEDARSSLMDAYQQKAMLFELVLDRSLQ